MKLEIIVCDVCGAVSKDTHKLMLPPAEVWDGAKSKTASWRYYQLRMASYDGFGRQFPSPAAEWFVCASCTELWVAWVRENTTSERNRNRIDVEFKTKAKLRSLARIKGDSE